MDYDVHAHGRLGAGPVDNGYVPDNQVSDHSGETPFGGSCWLAGYAVRPLPPARSGFAQSDFLLHAAQVQFDRGSLDGGTPTEPLDAVKRSRPQLLQHFGPQDREQV